MPDYETVYGNTYDLFEVTLTRGGIAADLTGATVAMLVSPLDGGTTEAFAMTVVAASTGQFSYNWASGWPSGGAGRYLIQYRATHGSGLVEVFPSSRDPYDVLLRDLL